jgi:hypothetical protein
MSTMCWDMCAEEPRVRPVVEGRFEDDERERDAAVEADLAPEADPSPPAQRVERGSRPAYDERKRVH